MTRRAALVLGEEAFVSFSKRGALRDPKYLQRIYDEFL